MVTSIKRITINKTTLQVSPVCLGADKFGTSTSPELSFQILDAYMDHGGNFLDTAAVYGRWMPAGENVSEQIIGQWLKSRKAGSSMIVDTKGGHYDLKNPGISRVFRPCITVRTTTESIRSLRRKRVLPGNLAKHGF